MSERVNKKAKRVIRVGSRESFLAVTQTKLVMDAIKRAHPEITLELVTMKTTGDVHPSVPPGDKGGVKGLFVKEIEHALLECRVDLAVHSLKDMPMEQDARIPIAALSRREDPRDAAVLPLGAHSGEKGEQSEQNAPLTIGCSSARRRLQLAKIYDNCVVKPIHGNILTRLRKLDEGTHDMLVLAAAGLIRASLCDRICRFFAVNEIIPAAGQGILACQCRVDDDISYLKSIADIDATDCAAAERAFVSALNGGCKSPVAAYAQVNGNELFLRGMYADEEGEKAGIFTIGSLSSARQDAKEIGEELAMRLKRYFTAD